MKVKKIKFFISVGVSASKAAPRIDLNNGLNLRFYRYLHDPVATGGEQYKNAHNKNQKRSHWLLFLRQINSTVCSIRTRTIRTFVQYKNAHNKNFCAV